jgi:hypothetical protein
MRRAILILLAVGFPQSNTKAQAVSPGTTAKIWADPLVKPGLQTKLVGVRGDTLLFRDSHALPERPIARAALTRIDVRLHTGATGTRKAKGTALGALAGFALGAAATALIVSTSNDPESGGYGAIVPVVLLTPAGAITGFFAAGRGRATWSTVDPATLRVERK